MMHRYKTIILDFDGTIADTIEEARLVLNEMSSIRGYRIIELEDIDELRNCTLSSLIKHLGIPKLQVPVLLAKGVKKLRSRIGNIGMIDGMPETIREIRKLTENLGILTSNSVENVELFLANNDLSDMFDFIRTSSKLTGKAKHLKKLMKQWESDGTNTIYIGDEVRDIESCNKAKLPIIAVNWGFNAAEKLAEFHPQFQVDQPAEILEIIQ